MAESFLSSKTDRIVLGRNISNIDDNLTDDEDEKPEADYDARNDETFGFDSSGDGLDDWEEGHEQFAMLGDSFGCGVGNVFKEDEGVSQISSQAKSEKQPNSDLMNNYLDDQDIEDSLNQLVLDDDVEDPAILGRFIAKPNSTYKSNDNRGYNSSPPPPAIVESDHVVGKSLIEDDWKFIPAFQGSPSTNSIWSTGKGDAGKGFANTLYSSFNTPPPALYDLQLMDPCIINASNNDRKLNNRGSSIPMNVKTVDEIENLILNSQNVTKSLNESGDEIRMKHGVLTVGELEKTLNDVKNSTKKPIGPPPGFGSRAHPRQDLSAPFSLPPRMVTPVGVSSTRSPSHMSHSMSPTSSLVSCNRNPAQVAHPIHIPNLRPNMIVPSQLTHPNAFRAPYMGQYAAGHPLVQVQYRPSYPMPYVTLGFQDKREALTAYPRLPAVIHSNHRPNPPKGFPNYLNGWNAVRNENHINSQSDVDEYANLMSKRDKEWLINIQQNQLQSDNPYLDDFYYTNYLVKKRVKETKEKEPTLVIPERSKVIETRTYKPVQFEGSLGKLQAGSVTCPRKLIDVHTVHTDDDDADPQKLANRETKKLKQLLFDIEKLYVLILQADDIDKRVIILPEEARIPLLEAQREVIAKLFNGFIQNGGSFLLNMMAIRKGRNLVIRSMPLFLQEQLTVLFTLMFSNLSTVLKRDVSEQMCFAIYDHFSKLVCTSGLDILNTLGDKLCGTKEESTGNSHCQLAMEHKIGIAFVCDMISRAEEIYVKDSSLNPDDRIRWNGIMSSILGFLRTVTLPSNTNFIPKPTFVQHLQRFSSSDEAVITLVKLWIKKTDELPRNLVT